MGTDDAICVDWRIVGSGNLAGIRGTEVEVLKAIMDGVCMIWKEGDSIERL